VGGVVNLAYRDIRHSFGRFVLTCLGLSLLLGVVLSMIGIYRGLVDDALVLVRTPQAQLWVVESDTRGPFAESSRIPGLAREAVARLYGVTAAGAVTYQSVELNHEGRRQRLYVVRYEHGRPGGPERIVAGRPIARAHYELVVDRRTGLEPGDRVRLGSNDFTVVGLTADQVDSGGNPVAYMTLLDAQELQFELKGAVARNYAARGALPDTDTINAVVARVSPHLPVEAVAAATRDWKHLSVLTQAEQEALLLESVVEKARRQIGLFTAILLTVSAVIIALIIYTMTLDKTREIATLKLIGAPDRKIAGLIVQQALAMGVIGFVLGAVLIASVAGYFPRRVVLQPWDGLALGAVVAIVCLLASVLGLRLALRIDPAQALGG
jgi:putative ABC transport system permease protein